MIRLFADPLNDMVERFANTDWAHPSISGPVISSLIIMGIVDILFIIVGIMARVHDPLKPSKGLLLLAETFYAKIQDWTRGIMGKEPRNWPGYFMCLFTYLFLAFIWSITGLPSTIDYLVIPFTLSLVMFVLIQATGIRYSKWKYFHRYIEPVPVWLPINLITMWTPIISTTLRMFGNCIAGSVIIGLVNWAMKNVSASLFSFAGGGVDGLAGIWMSSLPIAILNLYFALFSGYIQTLVFASLSAVWIGQEIPDDNPMGIERQATRGNKAKKSIRRS